jgi:LmbE family N-acetylglucosaminyl deacetylase
VETALARTTHLCVAAHQDDIEIMAHAGIATCYGRTNAHFTGVVVTDGAGSPRSGRYANFSDAQMREVRRDEQRRAALLGKYNLQLQLGHPSRDLKTSDSSARADLLTIFSSCSPEVVYLHNPSDKHDTHVAVLLRCLEALRKMPAASRPRHVYGCEVWRDLDWLVDSDKIVLDASAQPDLAVSLLRLFDSQVSGGKRYDVATIGRRTANATFHSAHATDAMAAVTWAMDLTPLVLDEKLSVRDYTLAYVDRLRADVSMRLEKFGA